MRVKKYEAQSMKEALDQVKRELGPDAVILNAKEVERPRSPQNPSGKVIEVTAAVSETSLHKKKSLESRLRPGDREKLNQIPAKQQKKVIDRAVEARKREMALRANANMLQQQVATKQRPALNRMSRQNEPSPSPGESAPITRRPITKINYIDIPDEMPQATARPKPKASEDSLFELRKEISFLKNMLEKNSSAPGYPGAEHGIRLHLSSTYERLLQEGLSVEYILEFIKGLEDRLTIEQIRQRNIVDSFIASWVFQTLPIVEPAVSLRSRVHMFVGGAGSGKTSALVKMAAFALLKQKKRIAIVSTDFKKIGSSEQLKTYAQILNVPYVGVRQASEWNWLLPKFAEIDYVFVDTSSGSRVDNSTDFTGPGFNFPLPSREMGDLRIHLVVPATAKDKDADEAKRKTAHLPVRDLVFTQADQSVQLGLMYNLSRRYSLPISAYSTGPHVLNELEWASRDKLLNLIFKGSVQHMPIEFNSNWQSEAELQKGAIL